MLGLILLALFLSIGGAWLLLVTPPERLAAMLRNAVPFLMIGVGGVLTAVGRGGFGAPLAAMGLAMWLRNRRTRQMQGRSGSGRYSTVRSAALEMELDHDSGEMNGRVLTGRFEGALLSELDLPDLLELGRDVSSDPDSLGLLEAYLDRRFPSWREDADANPAGGQGGAPRSGAMTKEEAYQVLGLEPGATQEEIREAWRRLMKGMHPDSGGSAFLAAKINAARDVLLD